MKAKGEVQTTTKGSLGAWGTNKLTVPTSKQNGTNPTAAAFSPTLRPKEPAGPAVKKPKNTHVGNNSGNNQHFNSKVIHGKKPKLGSIHMGDLVPSIKKILPRDGKKAGAHSNGKQATNALNAAVSSNFPALPSTSKWPSLTGTKPTETQPKPSKTVAAGSSRKAAASPKQANNNNNNDNSQSKKRKNQANQKDSKSGGAKGKNSASNTTNGDKMKLDDAHRQAQFFLPPGKTLDHNHTQAQLGVGGGGHDFMRMMQDGKITKGRQRIKPRKKRFSALKRKILLERLKVWKELHPEEAAGKDGAGNNTGIHASCTVCIYGFVSLDELEDDDEYEELIENLKDMASKVGKAKRIFIPRTPLINGSSSTDAQHPAFVEFSTTAEAMAARACWEGIVIGGQKLLCAPVNVTKSSSNDEDNQTTEDDWQRLCLEVESASNMKDMSMELTDSNNCKIVLKDVLTEDDLEDDDCFSESIQDIKLLVEKFGTVQDVQARKQDGNLDVTIVYGGGQEVASYAVNELKKLTLGGTEIVAEIVSGSETSPPPTIRLLLENVLTEDDLEDEDCLAESLKDVRSQLEHHGSVSSLDVTNGNIVVSFEGMTAEGLDSVAIKLNGVCLGGHTIKASCFSDIVGASNLPCLFLRQLLTQDDLDDEECLEESIEDVRELASRHGEVVRIDVDKAEEVTTSVVKITYSASSEAEAAAKEFDGLVMGGVIVSASTNLKSSGQASSSPAPTAEAINPLGSGENVLASKNDEPKPMFSGDKRIPERFAECKRAPKVPNKGTPRNYAIMTNDETVKPLLVEMLNELMRLQLRALHDPNSKNAKARRRVVAGLREVARGIRANKVKMIVMAHNLDEFGAIDEKLQEILDLAAEKELPVLFELSKRVLGKAVNKKIKVSVVGIQSTEGAHRQFVDLSKRAPHLIKPSSIMQE